MHHGGKTGGNIFQLSNFETLKLSVIRFRSYRWVSKAAPRPRLGWGGGGKDWEGKAERSCFGHENQPFGYGGDLARTGRD